VLGTVLRDNSCTLPHLHVSCVGFWLGLLSNIGFSFFFFFGFYLRDFVPISMDSASIDVLCCIKLIILDCYCFICVLLICLLCDFILFYFLSPYARLDAHSSGTVTSRLVLLILRYDIISKLCTSFIGLNLMIFSAINHMTLKFQQI
jgi:hypothetical protein